MLNTLALVTCTHQLEVAFLQRTGTVPSVVRLTGGAPRSTYILAAIDLLLQQAGTERAELGRVLVTRGPGSFTGIRAGLATAEGLSAALDIPVAAYPSLLAQAWRCDETATIWAAQPGRRGEVYAQRFVVDHGERRASSDIQILSLRDLPSDTVWIAAETVRLGEVVRAVTSRTSSEALLAMAGAEVAADSPVPLYVEGPPVDPGSR